MTREEARRFGSGLFNLYWKDGSVPSEAAVGFLHDGTPWFAPTNWTSKTTDGIACTKWRLVSHMVALRRQGSGA